MNWLHVILAGYAGAVIASVVGLIRKKGWVGKVGSIVLVLAAIAVWNIIDVHYLKKADTENNLVQVEVILDNMPTYKVIKEYDPQAFALIRQKIRTMIKDRASEQAVINAIQPQILKIQRERIQFAPDMQVVAEIKVNLEQMAAMQKKDDLTCFRFLFPGVQGEVNPARILPDELIKKRIITDAEMIRASYGENKHTVTSDELNEARRGIQIIAQKLSAEYGGDVAILDDPAKGVGKEKTSCDLVQSMWGHVIQMPEKEAAGMIRIILAAN